MKHLQKVLTIDASEVKSNYIINLFNENAKKKKKKKLMFDGLRIPTLRGKLLRNMSSFAIDLTVS